MKSFISDVSGRTFPIAEKVSATTIREGLYNQICTEHPGFTRDGQIAESELNRFRQQYIGNLLAREVGTLTDLERTVMDNLSQDHLITADATDVHVESTRGQRWADRIASFGGSWTFISIFGLFLLLWMVVNVLFLRNRAYDPYPFILLNLILSCLAAIQAPIIMMSQNRQEEKDRERARNDYMVNLKSEVEIRMLHEKIDHLIINQQQNLLDIQQIQVDMIKELTDRLDRREKGQGGDA